MQPTTSCARRPGGRRSPAACSPPATLRRNIAKLLPARAGSTEFHPRERSKEIFAAEVKALNMKRLLLPLLFASHFVELRAATPAIVLEAEQFAEAGGWDLDQQSMEQMGSPDLLAHGLGVPVQDAAATANFTCE
jgi:hypothetical protein